MGRHVLVAIWLLFAAGSAGAADSVDQALAYCASQPADKLNEADARDLFCKGTEAFDVSHFVYLKKSAELGYAPAQVDVGLSYEHGHGVAVDKQQARAWYLKAAEQGNAEGQNDYGYMLFYGKGGPAEPEKAIPWFQKAAAQDYTHAQTLLAEAYYQGKGVAKDYDQAFRLYSRAAEKGHPFAIYMTGCLYIRGHGVAVDEVRGTEMVRKAAERNIKQAQGELAELYEGGVGVTANDMMALTWYEVAGANGGNVAARVEAISARLSPDQVKQAKADADVALARARQNSR
jgi:TPR repeat protein